MVYRDQNDETLVMLTLAGEQRAYEVLVARYENAVIAAAHSVIHSRYMAEDAAQDAFITAWMKLNVLREPDKYGAWVCRIARNCAKNMVVRARSYLSLDVLENCISEDEHCGDPEFLYVSSEEKQQLHESISGLSEKVRQIIHLHYFEELSIAEIADRMRISVGTVKAQLHNGRKQIRKELGAMNEKANDTLVQRVMKKVEELKLWQFKNSKNGFDVVYKDVLGEVENLPESADKYHALADVLMRGWWWLPGDKNDALFARICETAELGKNDEVMQFIVSREDQKLHGKAQIEFIRDKQIPRLEASGFFKALAREWYWLGNAYCLEKDFENGLAAYEKVLSLLQPSDAYYALAFATIAMEKQHRDVYADKPEKYYGLRVTAEEYRISDGKLRRWNVEYNGEGWMNSCDRKADHIFRNASYCDGAFAVDDLSVGDVHTGSDGTTLTFAADAVTVKTPCGAFDGCELWVTRHKNATYRTYFKDGIGIVKQERHCNSLTEVRTLQAYTVVGGEGRIPCAAGNAWAYTADYDPSVMTHALQFTMHYADDKTVILSMSCSMGRLRYDENSWVDMIQQIRNEYCCEEKGHEWICDVSHAIERAEALAKTPMEKAHTRAACSVARRIMETDSEFNPDCTTTGHWNFFNRTFIEKRDGRITSDHDFRWSFEWKRGCSTAADMPLLYNDIYGILQDAANCIWSDEWQPGTERTVEYTRWNDKPIKTEIRCEAVGSVTTGAGTFADCMQISLDIRGLDGGLSYRGGKKEYTFAPGIGIVRTVNYFLGDSCKAVYELTAYEGTGEGYMPFADGMLRRYDALDLTDGYVGSAEYTYVAEDDGSIVIFQDRTGIREQGAPITQYGTIQGEVLEQKLWDAGKRAEGQLHHSINNFHLMVHYLARPSHNWGNAIRSIEINGFNMRLMEMFGEGDGVPPAWHALYAWTCLVRAAALFGNRRKEEGYEHLELALRYYTTWSKYATGQPLEIGNKEVFGDCRVIKDKEHVLLPDGTRQPIAYAYRFSDSAVGTMYYAMTAPRGWEWFNGVRNEDRFKALIDRTKKLMDTKTEK